MPRFRNLRPDVDFSTTSTKYTRTYTHAHAPYTVKPASRRRTRHANPDFADFASPSPRPVRRSGAPLSPPPTPPPPSPSPLEVEVETPIYSLSPSLVLERDCNALEEPGPTQGPFPPGPLSPFLIGASVFAIPIASTSSVSNNVIVRTPPPRPATPAPLDTHYDDVLRGPYATPTPRSQLRRRQKEGSGSSARVRVHPYARPRARQHDDDEAFPPICAPTPHKARPRVRFATLPLEATPSSRYPMLEEAERSMPRRLRSPISLSPVTTTSVTPMERRRCRRLACARVRSSLYERGSDADYDSDVDSAFPVNFSYSHTPSRLSKSGPGPERSARRSARAWQETPYARRASSPHLHSSSRRTARRHDDGGGGLNIGMELDVDVQAPSLCLTTSTSTSISSTSDANTTMTDTDLGHISTRTRFPPHEVIHHVDYECGGPLSIDAHWLGLNLKGLDLDFDNWNGLGLGLRGLEEGNLGGALYEGSRSNADGLGGISDGGYGGMSMMMNGCMRAGLLPDPLPPTQQHPLSSSSAPSHSQPCAGIPASTPLPHSSSTHSTGTPKSRSVAHRRRRGAPSPLHLPPTVASASVFTLQTPPYDAPRPYSPAASGSRGSTPALMLSASASATVADDSERSLVERLAYMRV